MRETENTQNEALGEYATMAVTGRYQHANKMKPTETSKTIFKNNNDAIKHNTNATC